MTYRASVTSERDPKHFLKGPDRPCIRFCGIIGKNCGNFVAPFQEVLEM